MWFEAILGLKINLEKSGLIPIGRGAGELVIELNYKVEERFHKRLLMWKR